MDNNQFKRLFQFFNVCVTKYVVLTTTLSHFYVKACVNSFSTGCNCGFFSILMKVF